MIFMLLTFAGCRSAPAEVESKHQRIATFEPIQSGGGEAVVPAQLPPTVYAKNGKFKGSGDEVVVSGVCDVSSGPTRCWSMDGSPNHSLPKQIAMCESAMALPSSAGPDEKSRLIVLRRVREGEAKKTEAETAGTLVKGMRRWTAVSVRRTNDPVVRDEYFSFTTRNSRR